MNSILLTFSRFWR